MFFKLNLLVVCELLFENCLELFELVNISANVDDRFGLNLEVFELIPLVPVELHEHVVHYFVEFEFEALESLQVFLLNHPHFIRVLYRRSPRFLGGSCLSLELGLQIRGFSSCGLGRVKVHPVDLLILFGFYPLVKDHVVQSVSGPRHQLSNFVLQNYFVPLFSAGQVAQDILDKRQLTGDHLGSFLSLHLVRTRDVLVLVLRHRKLQFLAELDGEASGVVLDHPLEVGGKPLVHNFQNLWFSLFFVES